MSLRELAEQDLGAILEDSVGGFGWAVTVTDPSGTSAPLTGFSDDIGQAIDPDTGMAVSGRTASVVLRISSLSAAGFSIPEGIADTAAKPWLVTFNDINGTAWTFKVSNTMPDRAIGAIVCILEIYA